MTTYHDLLRSLRDHLLQQVTLTKNATKLALGNEVFIALNDTLAAERPSGAELQQMLDQATAHYPTRSLEDYALTARWVGRNGDGNVMIVVKKA